MNLKLLRVAPFWSCSEKQKAKLCFCWNQKNYENYKAWLAWLFERLEVQSVVEHPRPAVSLELFTCWLLWTVLCHVGARGVSLKIEGHFVFKTAWTRPQGERKDQPLSTALSNPWKRLKCLEPDIAIAWGSSMYMAPFEPLFLFLPEPAVIPGRGMQGCLCYWCSSTLTKWSRVIPIALKLDCVASAQLSWKALVWSHTFSTHSHF